MNLPRLILAIFMAVAFSVACPLPTDSGVDINIDHNDATNSTLIRRYDGNQGALFAMPRTSEYWPVDKKSGLTVVKYCFQDAGTKKVFENKVKAAWKMWTDALGGDPGEWPGHNILMQEYHDAAGNALSCFDNAMDLNWNGAVPYETLAILLNGEHKEFSESTVGYYKGPYGQDQVFEGNFNYMRLEYSKEPSGHWEASIPEIAHEMGHALGMKHEQVRPDRDDHIHLNCKAVVDYAKAKTWKDNHHPDISMEDFCFSSDPQISKWRGQIPDGEDFADWVEMTLKVDQKDASTVGTYDINSIMQYSSWMGAENIEKCQETRSEEHCVMMQWVDKAKDVKAYISDKYEVTEKDAAGLRAKYPYRPRHN